MTTGNTGEGSPPRRRFEPWDSGQVLDHFVAGFEWTIPTRLQILDFKFQEQVTGEFDGQQILFFSVAPPLAHVHVGPSLLEDFLKLETASDEAILAYASRWGPLWLCSEHSLPWQHDPDCQASVSDWEPGGSKAQASIEDGDRLSDEDISQTWYDEPLFGWRDLSRQARATIRLARRLHDGRAGDPVDWDALPSLQLHLSRLVVPAVRDPFVTVDDCPHSADLENFSVETPTSAPGVNDADDLDDSYDLSLADSGDRYRRQLEALGRIRMAASMEFQRQLLGEVLNYWLEIAGVRPRLDWSGAKPAVQLGGHGLVGALAVQLLFDCSRTDGLVVCTSCGTPFLPGTRRPRRDRNVYCSDCGLKAASRDAAVRYRRTQKYQDTYRKWRTERNG